jgi:Rrf2 family protein
MQLFSKKIKYGLAALYELAKNYNKGFLQIKEISLNQKIPQNYLEQLLSSLRKAELVESLRGAQGGYRLKKPANTIKIIDIIEALDGPLTLVDKSKSNDFFEIYWGKIETNFKEILSDTLEDLVEEENTLHKRLFYEI